MVGLTRRELLVGISGAACGLAIGAAAVPVWRRGSGAAGPPLSDGERRALWQLAAAIGALWGMQGLTESELGGFVELKAKARPMYLAAYRNAIAVFRAACRAHPPPAAVAAILQRRGHQESTQARELVLAEFIRLHLARGGYRRFGLARAPGTMGGTYRIAPVQPGRRA
jgi:hypothetical protein